MMNSGFVRAACALRNTVLFFVIACIAPVAFAETAESDQGGVLWIGDSMSLCGLGERMSNLMHGEDEGKYPVVHAYMASGTNPMSWLKGPPYGDIGTRSGFWEIHRTPSGTHQLKDVYGMTAGHKPGYHKVPKLEDLLAKHRPEILIVQLGNCFHDFFPTRNVRFGKKVIPQHYLARKPLNQVPQYLQAFRRTVIEHGSSLKAMCWIAPASTGTVSKELGDTLLGVYQRELPGFEIFDSRKVTNYPYRHMDADGIHFWGKEAMDWSNNVHAFVASRLQDPRYRDMGSRKEKVVRAVTIEEEKAQKKRLAAAQAEALAGKSVKLALKLKSRSALMPPSMIYPYRNEMAAYEYEVEEVLEGEFRGDRVRILHPIYLDLEPTTASQLEEGQMIKGIFFPFKHTSPWATWPRADDLPEDFRVGYYVAETDLKEIRKFAEK